MNDGNSVITYNGSWTSASCGTVFADYNSDEKYSSNTGDYVQYTFNGTSISWITRVDTDMGEADVYIDGTLDSTIDCYSAHKWYQQAIYTKSGLSSGNHTIKIVVKGTKNSSSSGYKVVIDAFNPTGASFDAFSQIEAENSTALSGSIQAEACGEGGERPWVYRYRGLRQILEREFRIGSCYIPG